MRTLIPLKFFSLLLLVVMVTVTISGAYGNAHALQSHVAATGAQDVPSDLSAPHQCPCTPFEQHKDYDGCDTCVNCTCHASLVVQPFQLDYRPFELDLRPSDPFRFLPEVYLSKFIPPQKQA